MDNLYLPIVQQSNIISKS